jgi:hypothetical protein
MGMVREEQMALTGQESCSMLYWYGIKSHKVNALNYTIRYTILQTQNSETSLKNLLSLLHDLQFTFKP